jgi:hypothetical protein
MALWDASHINNRATTAAIGKNIVYRMGDAQ